GPGARPTALHSPGNDPGQEIIQKVWPGDSPFIHDRHQIMKAVKQELGPSGRELNFNAYADNRSLFRYDMHTLPSEVSESIGTSTLFAAWNAAIYVSQVEDDRLEVAQGAQAYLDATREVLRRHGGLWFRARSLLTPGARRRPPPLPARPVPPPPPLVPPAEPTEAARIAEFVRTASFEATRPSDAEIAAFAAVAAPTTPVYVSA